MAFRPHQWPGNVIPTSENAEQASRSLFYRAGWRDPLTPEVARLLQRWYDSGWCVDALLAALDRRPDNSRQLPRGPHEDVGHFLQSRLRAWFTDHADSERDARLAPPRPGLTIEAWLRINREQQRRSGTRARRPLGERGQRAREYAREQARRRRRDPLERGRDKDERISRALGALDELLPRESGRPRRPGRRRGGSQLMAAYAGRLDSVGSHPAVRRIVGRLAEERRRPTPAEVQVLRNALREARQRAGLDVLEASAADGAELSPQAARILAYLDGTPENASFDSMLALLRMNAGER